MRVVFLHDPQQGIIQMSQSEAQITFTCHVFGIKRRQQLFFDNEESEHSKPPSDNQGCVCCFSRLIVDMSSFDPEEAVTGPELWLKLFFSWPVADSPDPRHDLLRAVGISD